LKWIDYSSPHSVAEAVELLTERGDRARPMAGGTDIIVQMRAGVPDPDYVVDIKKIPELNELSYDAAGGLTIGAAVPCYKIYNDKNIASVYPAIVDSATIIGGTQIQGRASLGGNLCNAVPSADSIPTMIALGATANITGPNGSRSVPIEDFCTGVRKNVLGTGELLVSIHFPVPAANSGARYQRFIPRNEMDIAVVGVGASVTLNNGNFESVRVSLASVAPTPLFVTEINDALAGKEVNAENIAKAGELAKVASKPITDMRGTIEYRKHLCNVMTQRVLNDAVTRARGGTINAH
jgi:CO/xanthine dehydrogenase FAD-binding subunit